MKKFYAFVSMFAIVMASSVASAVSVNTSRVSVGNKSGSRLSVSSIKPGAEKIIIEPKAHGGTSGGTSNVVEDDVPEDENDYYDEDDSYVEPEQVEESIDCREAYRECMDSFCLLDESQGERCACSDNIERAKSKIQDVLDIQAEADELFNEGVEREKLGAKASLVFSENPQNTQVSTAKFMDWLYGDDEDGDVGEDVVMGSELYSMAKKYCKSELKSCGGKSEMEMVLYQRMIAQDCKNYDAYLKDQKANAESNKRIAQSAVRKARLEMLDTTNKYNRGECLLAYKACIADKGGCGANFENCLDANLLQRRANACDNVLDQCMAVRDYVKQDWAEESKAVMANAEKYAESKLGEICMAQTTNCLEETCSTSTNTMCLRDVNVAIGICPIIKQCDDKIRGFKDIVADDLASIRIRFCENDIDKCLQDKCGIDFTKPECIGKKPYEIAGLCPQDMFPSCKNVAKFDIIRQAALLHMDHQMYTGCVNYFSNQLSKVCGTDMACLPLVSAATNFTTVPTTEDEKDSLKEKIVNQVDTAVDQFFTQFEKDKTVAECKDSQSNPKTAAPGGVSLGTTVFNAAKLSAKMSAEQRNLREMESRIIELTRAGDLEEARQSCLTVYAPEQPDTAKSNYSYIRSVSFEPSVRNCHVCRMQQVCETGGESKMQTALKLAGSVGSIGASAGATIPAVGPVWGTAIGGVVGSLAGGVAGYLTADGKQEYCQEIESCEDINM